MDTTEIALLAFAGGSLMATSLSAFVTHLLFHPVISVRLDERKGSYGIVPLYKPGLDGSPAFSHDARFLRLHIENTGYSSVKACSGYITKLTKHTDKGQDIPTEEILDLGWAHHGHSNTRDIPRGAFFHMDVATLHLYPTVPWELVPPYLPTNLKDFFKDKGTYVLDVLVAADNTRPRTISVQFAYDPEIPALKDILWRRKAQFPWWSWWRRLRSRWQTRRPR
jgi:hypothetical protein